MKSIDGVIIEASIKELKKIYWNEEYYTLMSWNAFLESVRNQGAIITEDNKK